MIVYKNVYTFNEWPTNFESLFQALRVTLGVGCSVQLHNYSGSDTHIQLFSYFKLTQFEMVVHFG